MIAIYGGTLMIIVIGVISAVGNFLIIRMMRGEARCRVEIGQKRMTRGTTPMKRDSPPRFTLSPAFSVKRRGF